MSTKPTNDSVDCHIFSVTELNGLVREILEANLANILIEGEISNWMCSSYGHWYFTLKDEKAQIRCAMFRKNNQQTGFSPQNGQHILLRARVSLYEPRGDFQLIAEAMELAGDGILQRRFEALKQKLFQEGLFAADYKKPLPKMPRAIGVVTSPTGAAIRDIIQVLKRRCPFIPIFIYPASVQGEAAPKEIATAIALANHDARCDVLIVGRGGGSREDLWAFNEEMVARAIYASDIPVVSAVGHEIDVTISDFVADVRAPTPSAAAELVSPDQEELQQLIQNKFKHLYKNVQQKILDCGQQLNWLAKKIPHPERQLMIKMQRVDEWLIRLQRRMQMQWMRESERGLRVLERFYRLRLQDVLVKQEIDRKQLADRLLRALQQQVQLRRQELTVLATSLESMSPLATLSRGYALVKKADRLITDIASLQVEDEVKVQVAKGSFHARVIKIE